MMIRATWLVSASLALCAAACGQVSQPDTSPEALGPWPLIVADQFGYLPEASKIAIIREPVTGFDAGGGRPADPIYLLREVSSDKIVRRLVPEPGGLDELSGDRVWTVSFDDVTAPGTYSLESESGETRSAPFEIGAQVYDMALREAFRAFYYQRAGIEKAEPFADARWTDDPSHVAPGQDREARLFSRPGDAATSRDLSGGWYDAGDFNQYTNWTADYCRVLLMSFEENPEAWGDDFGIPESGNGISDLLDEVKWGLDWLVRMQNADGSVLSILGRDAASPPSRARGPSRYGPASTSATLSTAAAFAYAARIFSQSSAPGHRAYADDLTRRAIRAWDWAAANPEVTFYNNDARDASLGLGAGQQEVNEEFRSGRRFAAAVYLFALTADPRFEEAIAAGLSSSLLVRDGLVDAYRTDLQDAAFFAIRSGMLEDTTAQAIREALRLRTARPATGYRVPVDAVHWGSNAVMARTGQLHLDAARLDAGQPQARSNVSRAADYLHYFHGRNPLGKTYLTNMGHAGAENSVDRLHHSWFAPGTPWSSVSASENGPAPGFVVGGPNPGYNWSACCPDSCSGIQSCGTAPPQPPYGQPPLKAYLDFNDGWPLNSWEVTENSGGYQAAYLRLLAHFAARKD